MKVPHAIQRKSPTNVGTLVVDMNCMIYHVLREPKMTRYDPSSMKGWEGLLQEEVCKYLTHIWRSSGAPTNVYVALDGVVPYAKIKQQRYRRFKSAATATTEPRWDTNAITPGTEFMRAMGAALHTTGSKHGWVISDTDEPGEGEHKLLRWLLQDRRDLPLGPILVYGLDADLILLCLLAGDKLGPRYPIYLVREAMAFGKMIRLAGSDEVELGFFKIDTLYTSLQRGATWTREQFYDYIFGMSFCGNDFLPTGLSLRMRDEGHAILMSGLDALWKSGNHLVTFLGDTAKPNPEGLLAFAKWIAAQEQRLILTTIRRKMMARPSTDNEEENLPLKEQAESVLVQGSGETLRLRSDWQDVYRRVTRTGKDHVTQYWRGWAWILEYYQGLPISREWVYPGGYPPTWSDLSQHFVDPCSLPSSEPVLAEPLKPQEQLALVLPLSSWGLLLKTEFRNLPTQIPQYWPSGFTLETFGKRFGWECEPRIPLLTPARLRYEVSRMNRR